jgi:hypothetical protein
VHSGPMSGLEPAFELLLKMNQARTGIVAAPSRRLNRNCSGNLNWQYGPVL